ncbi:hypothetical protein BDN70DRAFT_901289 [Pholiota conissans]|uniref:Uncharacterized protein n=1 Tax=Pholiota conissans TaxID=109636 RepID=A0A9P5YMG0_9AGAR|nr:hypothetical protein BDN70DRAFT_901289 [Pholiota conissans]
MTKAWTSSRADGEWVRQMEGEDDSLRAWTTEGRQQARTKTTSEDDGEDERWTSEDDGRAARRIDSRRPRVRELDGRRATANEKDGTVPWTSSIPFSSPVVCPHYRDDEQAWTGEEGRAEADGRARMNIVLAAF